MLFFISVLKIYGETNGVIIFFLLFLYGLSNITLSFVFIPLLNQFNELKPAFFIFCVIAIITSSLIYIHHHADESFGVKWLTSLLSPVAFWLGRTAVCVWTPLISLYCIFGVKNMQSCCFFCFECFLIYFILIFV